jgi:hypothetical protein
LQIVGAGATVQNVASLLAQQRVVAGAAVDEVPTRAAVDGVV